MTTRVSPIVVEGVWKEFQRGPRALTVREALASLGRRMLPQHAPRAQDRFWALRDVSFEVAPGRVLGVIGANGAGKSTLLKLLSRIMGPTRGRVAITGRVGALVELAAGFHPELTGRENVFLQGAILGMSRTEVARQFDRIVDFASVGEFIDTPVKRYSSGMHARLGFAVAAHLAPDVLLVDEVLAVGDHRFQRRAFARLQEVVAAGAAAVVVSHQLERVVELADDAVLLADGAIVARGTPSHCVEAYIAGAGGGGTGTSAPFLIESLACDVSGPLACGDRISLTLQGRATGVGDPAQALVGVRVWALPGERVVFATNATAHGLTLPAAGPFSLDVSLAMNVGPGLYRLQGVVWDRAGGPDWQRGEAVVVRVRDDQRAFGSAYLEPRVSLRPR